jgi:deferrochelatase/peroxidase EfeB
MTKRDWNKRAAGRREFLGLSTGAAVVAALPGRALAQDDAGVGQIEPFWGSHQAGIITPAQKHSIFAAFDLTTEARGKVAGLLRRWTVAAGHLSVGRPVDVPGDDAYESTSDPADIISLPPSRLTLTVGFGTGLFTRYGRDRYGLTAQRPEALVDLPYFNGDQLEAARTGGDLSLQICADNPQVAFHAIRQLAGIAHDVAQIRWMLTGFVSDYGAGETPRNLMGFKDGTGNPDKSDPGQMDKVVWVGEEGPAWMRGGTYQVIRRARMALEKWDRAKLAEQEETFGRRKPSGAPFGQRGEFDPVDLAALDPNGDPVVPRNAHVRLAHQAALDGARVLRRSYSYYDGAGMTTESWPPYRQAVEFDAGLIFVCYQRDPRTGFIKIYEGMSRSDRLNQFVVHTGGGLFACPAGVAKGEFIGQRLLEART